MTALKREPEKVLSEPESTFFFSKKMAFMPRTGSSEPERYQFAALKMVFGFPKVVFVPLKIVFVLLKMVLAPLKVVENPLKVAESLLKMTSMILKIAGTTKTTFKDAPTLIASLRNCDLLQRLPSRSF